LDVLAYGFVRGAHGVVEKPGQLRQDDGVRLRQPRRERVVADRIPDRDDELAFTRRVEFFLHRDGSCLKVVDARVDLAEPEERRAHLLRADECDRRDRQRDQHPRRDRDDRGRVLGPQPEQGEPLAPHLMADAVADVRDAARDDGDRDDQRDAGQSSDHETRDARRSSVAPMMVNSKLGVHAAGPASPVAEPMLRKIVEIT